MCKSWKAAHRLLSTTITTDLSVIHWSNHDKLELLWMEGTYLSSEDIANKRFPRGVKCLILILNHEEQRRDTSGYGSFNSLIIIMFLVLNIIIVKIKN